MIIHSGMLTDHTSGDMKKQFPLTFLMRNPFKTSVKLTELSTCTYVLV